MTTLRIVDGGMLAFAGYHVLAGKVDWPLTFQVPRMLRSSLADGDDACVVCWNGERLWKRRLWRRYQAGRPEIWELAGRRDYEAMIAALTALGAVQYRTPTVESDEVMAALVHRTKRRHRVVIVSDDKDFFQLLTGAVRMRGRVRGEVKWSDVEGILGVTPAYVADYLALAGDQADGIPRVLRPTDARRLLATRGHVRAWIDRDLRVNERLKRRIEEGREQIQLNLALVDLSREAVESRGAPGEPLLNGWGETDRARRIGRRAGIGWLQAEDLVETWAPLRASGERARKILRV